MKITVYAQKNCMPCKATKKRMMDQLIAFEEVDVVLDDLSRDMIVEMGYSQTPVIIVQDDTGAKVDSWSGYRPDKIREYEK